MAVAPNGMAHRPRFGFDGDMTDKSAPTIDSYIAALPPHAEHIIGRIRALISEIAPDVRESIKYTMPKFDYAGTYLYVGAWKKHIGLYPVFPAEPALEADLSPFRARKDTVQFLYRNPIPYELIARIARARIGDG